MHSSHLCHDLMAISCEAMNLWVQQKQEIYWPAEQLSTDQGWPWTIELITIKKSPHTSISLHISLHVTCWIFIRPKMFQTKVIQNKKLWRELIASFLWYDMHHIENDAKTNETFGLVYTYTI
jgi:hypothetical protein